MARKLEGDYRKGLLWLELFLSKLVMLVYIIRVKRHPSVCLSAFHLMSRTYSQTAVNLLLLLLLLFNGHEEITTVKLN